MSTPATRVNSAAIFNDRNGSVCAVTSVAWIPARGMDFPKWVSAGRRLGLMGRCGQWGIGDWIRYGHSRFGERYARAARITGYDIQTLTNMVYVASRFDISRRRENLSWSHHEAVAALETSVQDRWLDRASAEKFSVADLRGEVRNARRAGLAAASAEETAGAARGRSVRREAVRCPHCGGEVQFPAGRGRGS